MDDQQQRGVDQSSQPVPPPPVLPPAMPASAPPPVIPAPLPVPVVPPPPTPVSVPSNLPVSPLGAAAEVPVINRTTKPAAAIEPQPDANLAVTPPPAAPRPALPWKLIGGITGGLIAIVGGGFLLWWLGIGFGAPRDPVKTLAQMAVALTEAKSYHAAGVGQLTLELPATTELSNATDAVLGAGLTTVTTTAGIDFTGDRAADGASQWLLKIDLEDVPTSLLPTSLPKHVTANLRLIEEALYIKAPVLALVLGVPETQWLPVPTGGSTTASRAMPLEAFTDGQRVGYERIGTVQTARYHFAVNAEKLAGNLSDLPVGTTSLDLWLGVWDHLPYQIKLTSEATSLAGLNLTASLSRFGQSITIAAPQTNELVTTPLAELDWGSIGNRLQMSARDHQRKDDLVTLQTALAQYKRDQGTYPDSGNQTNRTQDPKNTLQVLVDKAYLTKLPLDPLDPTYWYGYKGDGTTYELWAALEISDDPAGVQRGDYVLYVLTPATVPATPSASPSATPSASPSPTTSANSLPAV